MDISKELTDLELLNKVAEFLRSKVDPVVMHSVVLDGATIEEMDRCMLDYLIANYPDKAKEVGVET